MAERLLPLWEFWLFLSLRRLTDGSHRSQKGKWILRSRQCSLRGLESRYEVGGGDKTRLTRDELGRTMPELRVWPMAHLKCIYTSAHSMGNKQEELKPLYSRQTVTYLEFTETWWDHSHNCSTSMDGYYPFRRGRLSILESVLML